MAARTDATSDAILHAAGRLLASEGPAALTVRRIAAEAGGSTMNVYSRFGGKDGVVDALYREGFRLLAEAMSAALAASPPGHLEGCGGAYRRFAREHQTYYSVMFDAVIPEFEPSEVAKQEAEETLRILADAVATAMDLGVMRRSDPLHVAAGLWATNHGLVSLELKGSGPPDLDWETLHDETLAAMLRGLMP